MFSALEMAKESGDVLIPLCDRVSYQCAETFFIPLNIIRTLSCSLSYIPVMQGFFSQSSARGRAVHQHSWNSPSVYSSAKETTLCVVLV